jgi:[protein-PII] uridylyltransferase
VFLLEPNVKEGEGGLRDLHTLLWIGRVTRGIASLEDLAPSGLASDTEARELLGARDFPAARAPRVARIDALQAGQARASRCRRRWPSGSAIAATSATERSTCFMRDYYRNAAIIGRTAADLIERLTAPPEPKGIISRLGSRKVREGISIASGQLVVDESSFDRDPLELVHVFADSQRNGVTLSSKTRAAVRKRLDLLTDEIAQSEAAVDTFMGS